MAFPLALIASIASSLLSKKSGGGKEDAQAKAMVESAKLNRDAMRAKANADLTKAAADIESPETVGGA